MRKDDDLIAQVRRKADPGAMGSPVTVDAMEEAEQSLCFSLPPLLRRLYLEVGDGGFGPGYGFLPLLKDERGDPHDSIVGWYLAAREGDRTDSGWAWPAGLLPACDWGCAIMSCIDGTQAQGPVMAFDDGAREVGESMDRALLATHHSIQEFLHDWIADVDIWHRMFEPDPRQPDCIRNPFMGVPTTLRRMRLRK